jgi:hypothetical protein
LADFSAITIDVDSLRFYREIHGLPPTPAAEDPIYTVAMPRFWELIEELGRPATLFLIGEDAPRHAFAFSRAKNTGSEIASHSFAHDYRLITRSAEEIRADLMRADEALRPLSPDGRIHGFRAPGYNTSASLLSIERELGYRYDSSLLPSPLYFGARAAAISLYRVLGRPSRSMIGDLRSFWGPQSPYPPVDHQPWRSSETGSLVELPMTCEPLTRLPLFGTSWAMSPPRVRRFLLESAMKRLRIINFEMHPIDLLDASDLGIDADLAAHQRDLKVPASQKMGAFRALFRELADKTEVQTLAALAAQC